jgi:hypothetical protein
VEQLLDRAVALRYMVGTTEKEIDQNFCQNFAYTAIEAIEKSCGFLPDGREVVISPAGGVYIKQQEKRRWLRTTIGPSKGIIMAPNPELCASILKDIADVTADNYNTLAERVHHRAREILYKNFENVRINEEAIVRVSKGTCQNEKYTRVINYWPYNNNSKQASRTVVLSCSDDDPWFMQDVSIHGSYIYVLEAHHILSGKRHSFISKKNASNLAEQRLSRYTKSGFSGCNHDLATYNCDLILSVQNNRKIEEIIYKDQHNSPLLEEKRTWLRKLFYKDMLRVAKNEKSLESYRSITLLDWLFTAIGRLVKLFSGK